MERVVRRALVAMLAVALLAAPGIALAEETPPARHVVLVLAPYLSWADVTLSTAPTLSSLADSGAVGDINLRNRNRAAVADSSAQGALTFSAGSWAAADPLAPSAYTVDEYYEGGTAAEAFERMTGSSAADQRIVYLGLPRTERLNESYSTLDVVVGTMGGSIVDAGGATAAVGNSDSGYEVRGLWRSRPAALAAMDTDGRVALGDVSTELLVNDPEAPYGFRTDLEAFATALETAKEELAKTGGPTLIVLDPGDLQRARDFAPEVAPEVAEEHHAAAVRTLDSVVAAAVEDMPEDAVLIVAPSVVTDDLYSPAGLGPIVVSGPGWEGFTSSSSTQRDGLVTNLDVAATVLTTLGLEVPTQVLGNPMYPQPTPLNTEDRVAQLVELDETGVAIDSAKPAILNGYITLTTLILLLATVVILRARLWQRATVRVVVSIFRKGLLLALAVPPATVLMFAFDVRPENAAQAVGTFVAVTLALWVAALVLERFTRMRIPVAALSLLEAGLLLLDQWIGAPLSFSSFLGYSPLMAARYYGLGNEGAALLMGSLLVGLAFVFDDSPDSRWTHIGRRWGVPVLGLVMVATSAAPFWGANVGVIAWGVVGFAVTWALMNRYRITWRLALLALLAIVVLVAAFSFVDLTANEGSQTHLGRAWASAQSGGLGELWLIVVRKAETNLRVLTRTNWSYLLIAILAFLGFMRWRPQGDFAATLDENPHFSAAMAGCLVGGVAAYVTEDSGIVIPALIMLYVGTGILYLMLSRLASSEADADDAAEDAA